MDPLIVEHYETAEEWDRMNRPRGRLELLRTQELLVRHLPPAPARVLDVGGGPGVYAEWLAGLGYTVHLVDPVARHVEQALARDVPGLSATIGDARSLAEPDGSCDAVLLLGPLYHLTDRADRVLALREARRVVRPGGAVAAAAISRFASLYDGLTLGFLSDPRFSAGVIQALETGQHRNPTRNPDWFTTAYFHHPDELVSEAVESGLADVVRYGIEGPGGWLADLDTQLADPARRTFVLDAARRVETEPTLAGVSAHLLAVGHRPT